MGGREEYRRLREADSRDRIATGSTTNTRTTSRRRPTIGRSTFITTKLKDQVQIAFGRTMLFGSGLSALLTLMWDFDGAGRSVHRLSAGNRRGPLPRGWLRWLVYFGSLGAGFMLIEVAVLQRFVLLLGHPSTR